MPCWATRTAATASPTTPSSECIPSVTFCVPRSGLFFLRVVAVVVETSYLGNELPKIFATSVANLMLDGLMLLGRLVMALWARRKKEATVHVESEGVEMKGNAT